MTQQLEWIEIKALDKTPIGAVGFLGNKVAIVVSYFDDLDANRDGKVSWGEWGAGKLSPISLDGKAVTEVAMGARADPDIVMRDPAFGKEAARMFVTFANKMIVDGIYAVYFSRVVGMGASALSRRLVGGTIKQFVVRKGMESVAGKALKDALKN